jgi:sugar/nucleoside kinase (ribokinase family)
MTPRYAIIGDIAATIRGADVFPAGAAAIAIALAREGGQVSLRSVVGDDDPGRDVMVAL